MPVALTTVPVETAIDVADELYFNDVSETPDAINRITSANFFGTNLSQLKALADPAADRLLFWDDSAGAYTHLTLGTNLSITGTTIDAAGGGGLSGLGATDNVVLRTDGTGGGTAQASAITVGDASTGVTMSTTEPKLIIEQTGDASGDSRFSVENGTSGVYGARLVNDGIGLCDFQFEASGANAGNFRFEERAAQPVTGDPAEMQVGTNGSYTLVVSEARVGIKSNNAAYMPFFVRASAAQSANLTEWRDSASAVLAAIGPAGGMLMAEMTAPAAPAANHVILFAEDNGSGKTRLMARFATGAAQQVAIEP
jgi:hypothetical protein